MTADTSPGMADPEVNEGEGDTVLEGVSYGLPETEVPNEAEAVGVEEAEAPNENEADGEGSTVGSVDGVPAEITPVTHD